ncbi:hypothetical protein HanPI659440_Chr01g0006141 [Helianthus annuus]|nr:hypothetical protein HanPI659440_Chr01g0006141 [Helianthus annuus]
MSTGAEPVSTRKRKSRPKNPSGPNQAVINWKEDELNNLVQNFGFSSDWGVQFPTPNCIALDAPPGYIMLYDEFFLEGNFRLPMSKFVGEVLVGYGLHISQINALGLPRITHFEFICRANRIEPAFEKFNDPPKSLHDWKQKFFYICRGVIPIDMHYRSENEGVPRVNVSISYADQDWYTTLTRKVTPIIQLEERALVAAGMSMLWVPQNPRAYPVYGYKGKSGYSLMNVFDPNVGSAMVVAALPEDRLVWVDQIRDNFCTLQVRVWRFMPILF